MSDTTKSNVGNAGVALALIAGLSTSFGWIANHVAEPVTQRLIQNYDAQEANATKNTELLSEVRDGVNSLKRQNATAIERQLEKQDETHNLQRTQIDMQEKQVEEQKKAAAILKEAVPVIKKTEP